METFIDTYLPLKLLQHIQRTNPEYTRFQISNYATTVRSSQWKFHGICRLRNKINRESKKLRKSFFKEIMQHLNENDPKQWWRHIKDGVGLPNRITLVPCSDWLTRYPEVI